MNLLIVFDIRLHYAIEIFIPDSHDKINSYCNATEKLHMFDDATVIFKGVDKTFTLTIDDIYGIVLSLKNSLDKTLNNKRKLSNFLNVGDLGKFCNIHTATENLHQIDYSQFILWSSVYRPETWLYNKNDKIYLEICPTYPWLFRDLEEAKLDENFITFDEFMKNYKPIFVSEITRETAEKWIAQCDVILNSIIRVKL